MEKEAPKKIYLYPSQLKKGKILGRWFMTRYNQDSVEYTRTDYAKKRFIVDAKIFLSEIHHVCDITDENGYRIGLRDLQARFETYINEKLL